MNFKFCTHIHRIDRNKSLLKISGKVAVAVVTDSRKFLGRTGAQRTVIFAIAQLSCFLSMLNTTTQTVVRTNGFLRIAIDFEV